MCVGALPSTGKLLLRSSGREKSSIISKESTGLVGEWIASHQSTSLVALHGECKQQMPLRLSCVREWPEYLTANALAFFLRFAVFASLVAIFAFLVLQCYLRALLVLSVALVFARVTFEI